MNAGSTFSTALVRSMYLAVGSGLTTFLITWATTDHLKAPVIAGCVSALAALGFRGGIEGLSDSSRDAKGEVKPGDVGQPNR